MKKVILAYNRVSPQVLEELEKEFEVVYFENNEYLDDPRFVQTLQKTAGVIGLGLNVTKELLDLAPTLKIISNVSVGYDNLPLEELSKRGIMATNTPDVLNDTTADAIFGILIAAARRMTELDHYVKSGAWTELLPPELFGLDVHHKKLGIIGMGRIGQAIAKRGHFGFDMEILYHNRSRRPDVEELLNAHYVSMDELLAESDFVCLMVPASLETKNLISYGEFSKMKRTAIFINGSRGQNVDEEALYDALQNGTIWAAGTDVFKEEPLPAHHKLLTCKNLVTLPHIGSSTAETEHKMSVVAAKNLQTGLKGQQPPNLLNPNIFLNQ
ncbi:2-hydroxyacid dehydrogenase [Pseudobacillus wudalianchiensis]|uniref:2-hydroxyacid dehydrogenase n=1 Tax=Pseudobacillus wudalianchiensis TaxID=1743143 RepID=UPI0008087FD6|nr:D-glycerate dehydrogenase [Bacillus wudalianchiensis]